MIVVTEIDKLPVPPGEHIVAATAWEGWVVAITDQGTVMRLGQLSGGPTATETREERAAKQSQTLEDVRSA